MLLSALRDSENILFDYLGEPGTVADRTAGATLPSTVQGWLASTNVYSLVVNETNLVLPADKRHLLELPAAPNVDLVLMVNTAAASGIATGPIPPGWPPPQAGAFPLPDHYISMMGQFTQSDDQLWVNMNFWSWGENQTGWQGSDLFFNNYFGVCYCIHLTRRATRHGASRARRDENWPTREPPGVRPWLPPGRWVVRPRSLRRCGAPTQPRNGPRFEVAGELT